MGLITEDSRVNNRENLHGREGQPANTYNSHLLGNRTLNLG